MSLKVNPHLLVFAVDLVVLAALEQGSFGEQDVEDDASREDVAVRLNLLIFGGCDDLRGDVAGSPAAEEEVLLDVSLRC